MAPLFRMPTHPLSPGTIIAVDDNADDLFFITRLLGKGGIPNPVRSFQCSATALNHLHAIATEADGRALPVAVLIDGNMPNVDGFQLLRALRSLPHYAGVKLIMVSGSGRSEDRARALEQGATAYFAKFPAPEDLRDALGLCRSS